MLSERAVLEAGRRSDKPVAVLLHGGGLAPWSLHGLASCLGEHYTVDIPPIDGHGEAADITFTTIEAAAEKLVAYIDLNWNGKIDLLYGLSLGAQIVCQCLALRRDLTRYAIIESARLIPNSALARMAGPMYQLCYGLVKNHTFSRAQAKALALPAEMWPQYYKDSVAMSRQSLIGITQSNLSFSLPAEFSQTTAMILALAGEREPASVRRSLERLSGAAHDCEVHVIPGLTHGQLSLTQPERLAEMIMSFTGREKE